MTCAGLRPGEERGEAVSQTGLTSEHRNLPAAKILNNVLGIYAAWSTLKLPRKVTVAVEVAFSLLHDY
jgi:hypothetical protein